MSLISELKRRGVLRVVLAYLAAAWLLLQIADLVLPAYGFSAEAMATLISVVAIGIVPAAILAWVFEWTSGGLARDSGAAVSVARAKSMDRVIIVVLTIAIAYFAVDKFVFDEPPLPIDIDKSIAVLPFVNMSSDPEQDYFSDGISEELLNLLAKVQQLRVVSRSSSFAYRGEDIKISEVGEALNVAYVLEGSVRKAGDRIRITAQLIEASTDKHLWSETYDRELIDVFAIQDEVSASIIDQLRIQLTGEVPHVYRTDPETYAMYLRARQQVMKSGLVGDIEAAEILERVIARDPDYVPALLYLLNVISYERSNHPDSPYTGDAGLQRIIELNTRVLQLDPDNAEANTNAAWGTKMQHGFAAAAPLFQTALRQGSNNVNVLTAVGAFAYMTGHFEECARVVKRALERDPGCAICYQNYAPSLIRLGRLEEAEAVARQRVALAPNGETQLGDVLMAKGDYQAAYDVYSEIQWEDYRQLQQAIVSHAMGNQELFERLKDEFLTRHLETNSWGAARLFASIGDEDAALTQLDLTFSDSTSMFAFALWDEAFEVLHGDPRWEALRERAGMTDEDLAAIDFQIPDGI